MKVGPKLEKTVLVHLVQQPNLWHNSTFRVLMVPPVKTMPSESFEVYS